MKNRRFPLVVLMCLLRFCSGENVNANGDSFVYLSFCGAKAKDDSPLYLEFPPETTNSASEMLLSYVVSNATDRTLFIGPREGIPPSAWWGVEVLDPVTGTFLTLDDGCKAEDWKGELPLFKTLPGTTNCLSFFEQVPDSGIWRAVFAGFAMEQESRPSLPENTPNFRQFVFYGPTMKGGELLGGIDERGVAEPLKTPLHFQDETGCPSAEGATDRRENHRMQDIY